MWSKRVFSVTTRLTRCHKYFVHNERGYTNRSYLQGTTSDPLKYAALGEVLERSAHAHPHRVAVRSIHEDLTLTYEQLLTQADSLGQSLREQGFVKGDRLGIWSHNSSSWIIGLVAAARAGLIAVLINPIYEPPELSFCIKKTGMKGLLIGEKLATKDYYSSVTRLVPELREARAGALRSPDYPTLTSIITSSKDQLPGTFTVDSLIKRKQNLAAGDVIRPEDGCIIHFTSGTTGDPKAALDSQLGVVNNTYFVGKRNTYNEGHQIVCVQVPLFHALGSVVTLLGGLQHAATLVLAAPLYSVSAVHHALYSEKCTIITGTPTMYVDQIANIRSRGSEPPALRVALSAGAPSSPQLIRQIKQYLNADSVKNLYGLTETTASVFHSIPGESIDTVAETVGYIQDHVEVKVVDTKGQQVPFGSRGELVVRGYLNMLEYWGDPDKTAATIDKHGWCMTGDEFTISPDGYGRVVGRLKDIIVRGGENIAPKEIEDHLNTHDDIMESQVVGVPDDRLGEELCAVVRLREGKSINYDDIKKHCEGKLSKFKIPRILKVTDTFPKTGSGKIQKYKLKKMLEEGKL